MYPNIVAIQSECRLSNLGLIIKTSPRPVPNIHPVVQVVPEGLLLWSFHRSTPWRSLLHLWAVKKLLLPTLACWGSEWWCAAQPVCSKGEWSSSGYDPLQTPTVRPKDDNMSTVYTVGEALVSKTCKHFLYCQ